MQTAVITGGTDGIGRGLADEYLRRGAQVTVVGTRVLTAEGLESNFALFYLSRHVLSHGLADALSRARRPVVLNFAAAGQGGPVRWPLPRPASPRAADRRPRGSPGTAGPGVVRLR